MLTVTEQPKWPTLRWLVSEIKYYLIGASAAGLCAVFAGIVVSSTHIVFNKSVVAPPAPIIVNTPTPTPMQKSEPAVDEIAKFNETARQLTAKGIELADVDPSNSIALLIANKYKDPESLGKFIAENKFNDIYPLGFALFYSDGKQFISYETQKKNAIQFDTSGLRVTFNYTDFSDQIKLKNGSASTPQTVICLNILPIRIEGKFINSIRDNCFGMTSQSIKIARVGNVSIEAKRLGVSFRGAAWVIGATT